MLDLEKLVNIPNILKDKKIWVGFKITYDKDKKCFKLPINLQNNKAASCINRSDWVTYKEALELAKKNRNINNLGIVLENGITAIDIDHCIDENGMNKFASDVIERFKTYSEYSLSGHGVHIIFECKKELPNGNKDLKTGLEIYQKKRFIIMTGDIINKKYKKIENRENEAFKIHNEIFKKPEIKQVNNEKEEYKKDNKLSDDQIIEIMYKTKNTKMYMLWCGGTINGGDHSRDDLALCLYLAFFTHNDYNQIDRLFRRSGLYRLKWDRNDYRKRTIQAAIARNNTFYNKE